VSQTDKGLNRRPEQVAQNVSAASWKLTAEELVEIERIKV
jgi:aryl-alcohol dehydrogenase-like predicted oxidoreductase